MSQIFSYIQKAVPGATGNTVLWMISTMKPIFDTLNHDLPLISAEEGKANI